MLQRQTLVIETDLYYGRLCHRDRLVSWTDCVSETDMYHGQIVSWRQTCIMDRLCHRDRLILWTDCVM